MSKRPVHDTMLRLGVASSLARRNPERAMAYLLSYDMWNRYKIEGPQPEDSTLTGAEDLTVESYGTPRFMGHNVYVGASVPGNPRGILFLPEPTIRSMVGLWKTHRQIVEEMMEAAHRRARASTDLEYVREMFAREGVNFDVDGHPRTSTNPHTTELVTSIDTVYGSMPISLIFRADGSFGHVEAWGP